MSFISKEPLTFINIKLTDTGRRMMASGTFNMDKAVLLDREIDYAIDDSGYYNIFDNRVMQPADYHPDVDPINLDGSAAYFLSNQTFTTQKQVVTAMTDYNGFFTYALGQWTLDNSKTIGKNSIDYSTNATNMSNYSSALILDNGVGSTFPRVGDLLFIPWAIDPTDAYMISSSNVPLYKPVLSCWYKVLSANSPTVILDRPINQNQNTSVTTGCFIYPDNAIETYYSSATTQSVNTWNMNIVRTNNIVGTDNSVSGHTEYNKYGSIEFNGTRRFFGFGPEIPAVGFVHFSNKNTGNTYAEQLIEKSVEVALPMIMWHHNDINSSSVVWGATFYDYDDTTQYDPVAKTSFRYLKDRKDNTGIIVGRVYHKLKLIVITDQELLIALTYKANRNYTIPDFNLSFVNAPKHPLRKSDATGLCNSGYTYFVTYLMISEDYSDSGPIVSFGNPPSLPCGYIKKIEGKTDAFGNPSYLQLDFPNPDSFPFMRNETVFSLNSGWNAQYCQVLVNEQLTSDNYDVGNVPANQWKKMSELFVGGNGVYRCIDDGLKTINGGIFNNYKFIMSREDYITGTTYYNLPTPIAYHMNELNFGDECIFHGSIKAGVMATSFKTSITITAKNEQINSSENSTYDKQLHSEIFVTEIAILDKSNQVVAVGKPTYPIKKLANKYLGFKLEIDF